MLIIIWLFVVWTMFWSFGSVILERMQKKITWWVLKWFLVGRSECPTCHHQLHRYNLIPLYSWFRQKGKCMYCTTKISSLYPVLEMVSGCIFALRGWIYLLPYIDGLGSLWLIMLFAWRLLWLLLVWDIYTYELHVPVWFILLISLVLHALVLIIQGTASWYLLGASWWFLLLFLVIYRFGKWYAKLRFWLAQEVFGQWDVMLAPLLGFLFALAYIGQKNFFSLLLFFILASCLIGLAYYAIAMVIYRIQKKSTKDHIHQTWAPMIPFLPSMIIAYWGIVIYSLVIFS